jgi:hypothetical protein
MKKRGLHRIGAVIVGVGLFLTGSWGGELAQCLLKNTPPEKQEVLVKFVLGLYAQEPKFRGLLSVNKAEYERVEREAVNFLKELPKKCAPQFAHTFISQGIPGIQREFNLYGQMIGEKQASESVAKKVEAIVAKLILAPEMLEATSHSSKK